MGRSGRFERVKSVTWGQPATDPNGARNVQTKPCVTSRPVARRWSPHSLPKLCAVRPSGFVR